MRKLRQEFSDKSHSGVIPTPRPFCQDKTPLSGGILSWPRPGIARGASASHRTRDRKSLCLALSPAY
ncbi:MAG: hypothetical protein EBS82_07135 [Methylocystaceae bacterium]|nr:hypothetical protein [Methylocystaceae bacterium]